MVTYFVTPDVSPGGIEPPSQAPQARILSVKLRGPVAII